MGSSFTYKGGPADKGGGHKLLVSARLDTDRDGQTHATTQVVTASNSPDSVAIPVGTNELLYNNASDPMTILVRAYASKPTSAPHVAHTYVTSRATLERIMQKARFAAPGMTYQAEASDIANVTDNDGALLFYATVTNGRVDMNIDLSSFPAGSTPYLEWQLNYPLNASSKLYTRIVIATDGTAGPTGARDTGATPVAVNAIGIGDGPLTVAEPASSPSPTLSVAENPSFGNQTLPVQTSNRHVASAVVTANGDDITCNQVGIGIGGDVGAYTNMKFLVNGTQLGSTVAAPTGSTIFTLPANTLPKGVTVTIDLYADVGNGNGATPFSVLAASTSCTAKTSGATVTLPADVALQSDGFASP